MNYADAHSDYPMILYCREKGISTDDLIVISPEEQKEAGATAQIMALWPLIGEEDAYTVAKREAQLCPKGYPMTLEGCEAIGEDFARIEEFYRLGVRFLGLTWNGKNAVACGCEGGETGLTAFGREAIREAERLGMRIDLSHANEQTFWDAMEFCREAPIVSHSNVHALCPHPRNLTDDQIREVIRRDCFMGINFYSEFLAGDSSIVEDIAAHIEAVCALGGENNVGFGADFCGMSKSPITTAAGYGKLGELLEQRLGKETAKKICYGNFTRIILE